MLPWVVWRLAGGIAGHAPREGEKHEEHVTGKRTTRSVTRDIQASRATRVSTELTSLPWLEAYQDSGAELNLQCDPGPDAHGNILLQH